MNGDWQESKSTSNVRNSSKPFRTLIQHDQQMEVSIITADNWIHFSVRLSETEIDPGLIDLKAAIVAIDGIEESSVEYENGYLVVKAELDPLASTEEITDRIVEEIAMAFPSLCQECYQYQDSILGPLRWDEQMQWLSGEVVLDGEPVAIHLPGTPAPPPAEQLQRARDFVTHWTTWKETLLPLIVQEMLPLYLDGWWQIDENAKKPAPLTPAEFLERIIISWLSVDEDASSCIYFYPDGMFTEHEIRVDIGVNGSIGSIGIE